MSLLYILICVRNLSGEFNFSYASNPKNINANAVILNPIIEYGKYLGIDFSGFYVSIDYRKEEDSIDVGALLSRVGIFFRSNFGLIECIWSTGVNRVDLAAIGHGSYDGITWCGVIDESKNGFYWDIECKINISPTLVFNSNLHRNKMLYFSGFNEYGFGVILSPFKGSERVKQLSNIRILITYKNMNLYITSGGKRYETGGIPYYLIGVRWEQ